MLRKSHRRALLLPPFGHIKNFSESPYHMFPCFVVVNKKWATFKDFLYCQCSLCSSCLVAVLIWGGFDDTANVWAGSSWFQNVVEHQLRASSCNINTVASGWAREGMTGFLSLSINICLFSVGILQLTQLRSRCYSICFCLNYIFPRPQFFALLLSYVLLLVKLIFIFFVFFFVVVVFSPLYSSPTTIDH